MRSFFLLSLFFTVFSFAVTANPALDSARELASDGIIVNQSSAPAPSATSNGSDVQEATMYRLDDTLIRQEALSVALKLKGVDVPPSYLCRGYFQDISEKWVCRVVEFSADYDIVTRENTRFRPHDPLTLAESLKILMVSLDIPFTKSSTQDVTGDIPDWQKRIILTIEEKQIYLNIRDVNGRGIAVYDIKYGSGVSGFNMSHRMTRGEFFQLVTALQDSQQSADPTAHCTVYNDGCNDCSVGDEGTICTKRACFWKGIPSCSACEAGYTLENNRCVKKQTSCISEGGYAGGGFVPYPENLNDFQCCSGLTRAERKDGNTLTDAGYTCIREYDNYCDAQYESTYNSSDCRTTTTFDPSICQGYYDGCNSCSKTSDGNTMCTMMYCPAAISPAYCTSYIQYKPVNITQDQLYLDKITQEIKNYTSNKTCTSNSDCRVVGIGVKGCGGPTSYLSYSALNINLTLLNEKIDFLTTASKQYNQQYSIMSDCSLLMPPAPQSCQAGTCQ